MQQFNEVSQDFSSPTEENYNQSSSGTMQKEESKENSVGVNESAQSRSDSDGVKDE